MRPQVKRKMIAGLVSAAGAAVLALGTLTAGAVAAPSQTFTTTSDGPQSANIPYVAWVGEHVRLVACDPRIETSEVAGQRVNFHLEDWSGDPNPAEIPESESGSQAFFAPSAGSSQADSGDGCVKIDYKSLIPGLGRIRAVVTNAAGTVVYSHQFLVIWLTLNKPTMTEVPAEHGVPFVPSSYLGDPSGNGELIPSPFSEPEANTDKGLIQIKVTGSFPVEPTSPLHGLLPEASYNLPESWPTLAKELASSSEETAPPGSNPGLWDIHETLGEGGASTTSNESGPNPLNADYFRSAFGNFTSGETATVGPFDPEAPNETLLSDGGEPNAEDTPMPAMRVDVHLAANEGSGLGGVGQITGASKALIYSHGFNGEASSGNLYNPYYGAYIPATDRPVPQASGIDGPSAGGDFPGFLNKHPDPYTYWTSVLTSGERSAGSTGCLQRTGYGDEGSTYYQTPSGPLNETFYTDERGEVLVTYTPGDGFYLNHIPVFEGAEGETEAGKIVKNADGGCDLKGLYNEVIGESSISATAVYPYQPVDFKSQSAEGPLVKKVRSKWEKEFFEFPKGNGKEEQNVRIVVAKAQDIDGRPIVDETVCFHAQQEAGLYPFSNPTNGDELNDPGQLLGKGTSVYLGGSWVRDPFDVGSNHLCVTTNDEGLAAIDLVDSSFASVDLTARYENEEIIRDHLVEFPTNLGAKEKKAAEEKATAEKQAKAEKEAAEKAAKEKAEKELAAEITKDEREEKAEKARIAREEAAEKARNEKEKAKEEFEKRTAAEITKADETRATEEATEKARRETEASEESARRAKEIAEHKAAVEAQVKPAASQPLVTTIPGGITVHSNSKKAHAAAKKKKGNKKGKKSGKKGKKK
jgi:flagellar biosynthesis GTPase FlhF